MSHLARSSSLKRGILVFPRVQELCMLMILGKTGPNDVTFKVASVGFVIPICTSSAMNGITPNTQLSQGMKSLGQQLKWEKKWVYHLWRLLMFNGLRLEVCN
ncbi:hypothetical protein SUGI_0494240 [Cryptomeria japonica]|nr:hypothetical protein SUGI_0494240 [Cryptomeria japonica]